MADVLLNHVEGMQSDSLTDMKIMPFAVEAAWVTGRWESLARFMDRFNGDVTQDYNIAIGGLFRSLREKAGSEAFVPAIGELRAKIASAMNNSATTSLHSAHDLMLKCHVLADVEMIVQSNHGDEEEHKRTMGLLDRRLDVIGAYFSDKQYLLGIRRAAMELMRYVYPDSFTSFAN